MARILYYGSRLAALGTAAAGGWWLGSATPRARDGSPVALFDGLLGKVSAEALQGYNMQAPAELPQLDPGAPKVTQIMRYGFPGLTNVRARDDYVISYDTRNRVPYWVCEHLTPENVTKNPEVDRAKCDFHHDDSIHEYFRSENRDYKGSGFDRGHMAAAGNHRLSQKDCHQTFLLSNMAPQVGKGFNRDKWNELESHCRKLTRNNANVYVCTGPLYLPRQEEDGKLYVKYQVLGQNHVAVPTHFFKVVVCETHSGTLELESFLLPNAVIGDSTPLSTFHVPVEVVERASGLLFFDRLSKKSFKKINGDKTGWF
ncbi:Endonuclease G, mitochondrial [Chionoecetes opilio]|uniref:Endonuclease n=1 Tax=Chionoecetes opilio TaxID=41210 RepID=A0A8J4Y7V4_CHIOP|nr:Endonuclease G, mitochondrial [Chionoecetes opilio]